MKIKAASNECNLMMNSFQTLEIAICFYGCRKSLYGKKDVTFTIRDGSAKKKRHTTNINQKDVFGAIFSSFFLFYADIQSLMMKIIERNLRTS